MKKADAEKRIAEIARECGTPIEFVKASIETGRIFTDQTGELWIDHKTHAYETFTSEPWLTMETVRLAYTAWGIRKQVKKISINR